MKVALIAPCFSYDNIGVRILSSCLKKEGHAVSIIHHLTRIGDEVSDAFLDSLIGLVKEYDVAGLSVSTNFFNQASLITERIKQVLKIPVIWGGIHPTVHPEECLLHADIVCRGESEASFIELINRMDRQVSCDDIQGTWTNTQNGLVKNTLRPLLDNLNSLPFPDYSTDDHHYFKNESLLNVSSIGDLAKLLNYEYRTLSTRGCPFHCTYCWNSTLHKLYSQELFFRKRSIQSLIDELIWAKSYFPDLRSIVLDDDSFLSYSDSEIEKFTDLFRRHIGLCLRVSGMRSQLITEQKLGDLIHAGLSDVRMGIQTACPETRKLYGRNETNSDITKAAQVFHKYRNRLSSIVYDIIVDNPWESESQIRETIHFILTLPPPFNLFVYSLVLYPSTDLHSLAEKEGLISNRRDQIYNKHYAHYNSDFLNKVIILIREYSSNGDAIPAGMIRMAIHPRIIKTPIAKIIFYLLKLERRINPIILLRRITYLVTEFFKDIIRWDLRRIRRFLHSKA